MANGPRGDYRLGNQARASALRHGIMVLCSKPKANMLV